MNDQFSKSPHGITESESDGSIDEETIRSASTAPTTGPAVQPRKTERSGKPWKFFHDEEFDKGKAYSQTHQDTAFR